MAIFIYPTLMPNDPAGFSVWLQQHYLEHQQFVRIFQVQTHPIFIPDYNFALWDDDKKIVGSWLEAHQATHLQLRAFTGVDGINLADVDLSKQDQWFSWMDDHASEHAAIRAALGIT
jgi:hypothetical protein